MIPQDQRSKSWLDWRKDKIGSSCASSIMGCGFKAIGQLWEEKLGLRQPEEENEAMKRGNELEDEARTAFEHFTGLVTFPMVCVHKDYPWCIASLDGMTIEKDAAVEIKCPGKKIAIEIDKTETLPSYYIPQLQHQMAVTGLSKMYFFAYYPKDPEGNFFNSLIIVKRDDAYIAKLIEREKQFYELLIRGFDNIWVHESSMDHLKDEVYKILEENETQA